jgi:hypothetical protein
MIKYDFYESIKGKDVEIGDILIWDENTKYETRFLILDKNLLQNKNSVEFKVLDITSMKLYPYMAWNKDTTFLRMRVEKP